MKKIVFVLLLLLILASCTQKSDYQAGERKEIVYYASTISFKISGESSDPDMKVQELTADKDTIEYKAYDSNNQLTKHYTDVNDPNLFREVVGIFNENDFFSLNDTYALEEGQQDPKQGFLEITVSQQTGTKTVKVEHYILNFMPVQLQNIAQTFQVLDAHVKSTTENEARNITENWILDSPTYLYDGSGLKFVNYTLIESVPEQHVFTYEYTGSHKGYGDRSNVMVLQGYTTRNIVVTLSEREIVSAIIDNKWDELNQMMVSEEDFYELKFQPMQCVRTPWEDWEFFEDVHFIKEPSAGELASRYYNEVYGIDITSFTRTKLGKTPCLGCEVCPEDHYFTVKVKESDAPTLLEEGWVQN